MTTGCFFVVINDAEEMLSYNFYNSASFFSLLSMLLIFSSTFCQIIWLSEMHAYHSKQILLALAIKVWDTQTRPLTSFNF